MARISYPDPNQISTQTRDTLGALAPLNIFRMMSHAGHLLDPFSRLGGAFLFSGNLNPVIREIAILRVGYLSKATYETAQHEKIGRDVGMTEQDIAITKAGPNAQGASEEVHDVLAYVDDLVAHPRAKDDTFGPILKRYGPATAQELTLLIGYYMMVCRFLETFGVDIEDGGAKGLPLADT